MQLSLSIKLNRNLIFKMQFSLEKRGNFGTFGMDFPKYPCLNNTKEGKKKFFQQSVEANT